MCGKKDKMKRYKYSKPPIYFLLPVCAGGCFWPACGRPAGCWSRSSSRRCESSQWSRWQSWQRWRRSPHSRWQPPGRCGWLEDSVGQLDGGGETQGGLSSVKSSYRRGFYSPNHTQSHAFNYKVTTNHTAAPSKNQNLWHVRDKKQKKLSLLWSTSRFFFWQVWTNDPNSATQANTQCLIQLI